MTNMIASTLWSKKPYILFYVAEKKGKVGDWGYTTKREQAIPLSPYWQRRFSHDRKYCSSSAMFEPAPEKTTDD